MLKWAPNVYSHGETSAQMDIFPSIILVEKNIDYDEVKKCTMQAISWSKNFTKSYISGKFNIKIIIYVNSVTR